MKIFLVIVFFAICLVLIIFGKVYDVNTVGKEVRNNGKFENAILDDNYTNLYHFLQISDLHLSKFKDETRIKDFNVFCSEIVDIVKPPVVIASGDLTDAKDELFGSGQYREEWSAYYDILKENNVLTKTKWLDIRGNHDNFNVQYLYHSSDLFRNFSAQGNRHRKSYIHQEIFNNTKYNFVALDASIEPGTKRPYNFIGILDTNELERVKRMVMESNGDFTIWFAHYPTSSVLTPPGVQNIRKFIGQFDSSLGYLAGHLHTLGRFVNKMYALHPEGFLELELADFLRTRRYRLATIDHGMLSIIDFSLHSYPFAIITNPKNMLFNNPFRENIELQKQSTHIRILAFSKKVIVKCSISIDDDGWQSCEKKTENFFVVPWDPSKYIKDKHEIKIYIRDADGNIFENSQYFAMDGSRISFDFLAKFVLMSDLTTLFQIGYVCALLLCLNPLIFFKGWQLLLKYKKLKLPKIESNFWRATIYKFLLLAAIDRIFYGLLMMILWTTFGPWSFHEVLDGHVGYNFLWGIFVNGNYVAGALNYWYGLHQLVWFQFPLMIILADVLKQSYKRSLHCDRTEEGFFSALKSNLSFVALMIAELSLSFFYIIQNGFIAFLIAPLRVWSVAFSLWLFYQSFYKIPESTFQRLSYLNEVIPKRS